MNNWCLYSCKRAIPRALIIFSIQDVTNLFYFIAGAAAAATGGAASAAAAAAGGPISIMSNTMTGRPRISVYGLEEGINEDSLLRVYN